MPVSKCRPEDSYEAFHTHESFTSVARRLGVVRLTLRRWWVRNFGEEAFQQRPARCRLSPDEQKERRRRHRESHAEAIREAKKKWVAANPDRARAYKQAHREAHRDEYREYCKAYYAKNAERFRDASRQYREVNLEKVRLKEKDYYTAHPEILLFKGARVRAKRWGLPFNITAADVKACIPKDGRCPITSEPFERGVGKVGPRSMTLDRVEPSRGYVRGNISVISHLANTIKQNCTDPNVFRRIADYIEDSRTLVVRETG